MAQGVHGRRRVGQGDSFWQFRRFVAGRSDRPHGLAAIGKIRSPRPDGWFIRETEWEAAQTVCLWRDAGSVDALALARRRRWRRRERAGLLLLALASLLLRGGERVAMIEPDAASDFRPRRAGPAGRQRSAGVVDEDAGVPPRVLLPRHARVVLIGDFLSPLTEIRR